MLLYFCKTRGAGAVFLGMAISMETLTWHYTTHQLFSVSGTKCSTDSDNLQSSVCMGTCRSSGSRNNCQHTTHTHKRGTFNSQFPFARGDVWQTDFLLSVSLLCTTFRTRSPSLNFNLCGSYLCARCSFLLSASPFIFAQLYHLLSPNCLFIARARDYQSRSTTVVDNRVFTITIGYIDVYLLIILFYHYS